LEDIILVLTKKQEEGLKIAVERYNNGEPWTCIAGYAGTGKSTLVKFIVAALNLRPDDVCYITFTGKAALVLRDKGCPNAMTAHRLLYQSFPKYDGTFYHKPRRPIPPYKLIIVDEISMLPDEIWQLLLSHNVHIIALGDPGQLPPIGTDNGVLEHPHIFLDEIMRQAQESEIIKLTMDIRAGKPLQLMNGKEVKIVDKKDVVEGMYLWADQIIVGKNETRRYINDLMRQYLHGVTDTTPIEGDKVICLRNDWDHPNEAGDVMVNGTIGTIYGIKKTDSYWLKPMMTANFIPDGVTETDIDLNPCDPVFRDVNMDYKLLTTGEPTVNKNNFRRFPKEWRPREFDYGYCITCHKAQGSEYNKVLVFEEFLRGNDHARWLYTAATRAKEKLVIVRV
jgi:exodeoxyribonuclease-5